MREINFDGLVGPTHNYAGLSFGNVASATNAGATASPRGAALEGLAKMRRLMALGLTQGILLPHPRPDAAWLRALGFAGSDAQVVAAAWQADPALVRHALSASAMWTANAGTVSPGADTADGRCHITVANLSTMLHRSIEPEQTARQLRLAFADRRHFAIHDPLPAGLGDEGAANAMRLTTRHGGPGLEVFVYGARRAQGFPARQHRSASAAVARRHGLDPARVLIAQQSEVAIAAGAFHNDVVAVANEHVLFCHQGAFEDRAATFDAIRQAVPDVVIVEAPSDRVPLAAAVRSYVFNSQLVTLPQGGMALIVPGETRDDPQVWAWVQGVVADERNPIARVEVIDLRGSMRNGGGPACLRLRVPVSEAAFAAIDARFLLDEAKADRIAALVERHWPERVAPEDLGDPHFWAEAVAARAALLAGLNFAEHDLA